ncbi:endonuclease domain-containing protein [Devosia sp. Root685]|uniref:endonuclease domain-containing protein n=1 Tax=Devosia sp. Root685 TaxID=1736587 RepID=UPI0012E3E2B6|nr:endonuclease domain-containing protein [Devosia sp. Root685]
MTIERSRQLRKSMPGPEAKLWSFLRELRTQGHHFRRQVQIGPYYVDFLCHGSKLVIEVDGDTHFVGGAQAYDARRDQRIAADGFRVVRFTNYEVTANLDGVMEAIISALAAPHP